MERAVDPHLLRMALGDLQGLPDAETLTEQLAQAEIATLLGRSEFSADLLKTGWYLFGVASSHSATDRYGFPRQRSAFRVASHIFDLALQQSQGSLTRAERLELCFAGQIASLKSELAPNASAIYNREFPDGPPILLLARDVSEVAVATAAGLTAFDLNYVRRATQALRDEATSLVTHWGIRRISDTTLAAAAFTAYGCADLANFLLYGHANFLERARTTLYGALNNPASAPDLSSRWVAAQLLNLIDGLNTSSIWTALPPDVSPAVRRAFVMTQPPIVHLWPPQLQLVGQRTLPGAHALSPQAKRQLICTPTSGGKTLMAQLLIAAHLDSTSTSVCYVAPTRSLCREVRTQLDRRLRSLGRPTRADLPSLDSGELAAFLDDNSDAGVEVMTPERLSYLLHSAPDETLARFGLFVIDEAHNVADVGRGWTLESSIAFLHHATRDTGHRLVLVSAGIGNQLHFVQWLGSNDSTDDVLHFHADWRGPRRLHCVWTTDAQWTETIATPGEGTRLPRETVPLLGRLSIRVSSTGQPYHLVTDEPIGKLIRRKNKKGEWAKDENSTPFYRMLVPLVESLLPQGPVLVLEATRANTVRLARTLAKAMPLLDTAELRELLDLSIARLGQEHPLSDVLRRGVAFHHGSLPSELRAAIEELVGTGALRCVVATTTLTEGINLPVRSVIIASQGVNTKEGVDEFITGSRLLNAIGRAGRAVKETEGVVVLARQAEFAVADFERLRPDEETLTVVSMLATEQALKELADFEALVARQDDAVFACAGEAIPRFLSFAWFLASTAEAASSNQFVDIVFKVLRSTLGWIQLDEEKRRRWEAASQAAIRAYKATAPEERRRWASSGANIASARQLDRIAADLHAEIQDGGPITDISAALEVIFAADRFSRILSIAEAPHRRVWTRRSKGRSAVTVDLRSLVRDWVNGAELTDLATNYLSLVEDSSYRFEQLGDVLNDYCETFLPWVIGTLVGWVNARREAAGDLPPFPRELAAYIRYGVNTATALRLSIGGIQSRRLCTVIARQYDSLGEPVDDVRTWLASMSVTQWRERFLASKPELRNLVQYSRSRTTRIAETLLSGSDASVVLESRATAFPRAPALIQIANGPDLDEAGVWCDDVLVGVIPASIWPDVEVLLKCGISYRSEAEASGAQATLWLHPVPINEDEMLEA